MHPCRSIFIGVLYTDSQSYYPVEIAPEYAVLEQYTSISEYYRF